MDATRVVPQHSTECAVVNRRWRKAPYSPRQSGFPLRRFFVAQLPVLRHQHQTTDFVDLVAVLPVRLAEPDWQTLVNSFRRQNAGHQRALIQFPSLAGIDLAVARHRLVLLRLRRTFVQCGRDRGNIRDAAKE